MALTHEDKAGDAVLVERRHPEVGHVAAREHGDDRLVQRRAVAREGQLALQQARFTSFKPADSTRFKSFKVADSI